jgi:protein-tyrosine phosphatase
MAARLLTVVLPSSHQRVGPFERFRDGRSRYRSSVAGAFAPCSLSFLQVETQPNGTLGVSWEVNGEPFAVDVSVGPTPSAFGHRHVRTVPAGQQSVEIPVDGPGRRFVSVRPQAAAGPAIVAADRSVRFRGITNFRDIGGYPTRTGGWVRWGLVFRSSALHGLGAEDLALFHELEIREVFDLRGDVERDERPNAVPSRVMTISGRPPTADTLPDTVRRLSAADGELRLIEAYSGLLDHGALRIGELFTALSTDRGVPAVIHCLAGKDRTGVVAALLLELLGVERRHVLDDYELSARYMVPSQQQPTYERLVASGYTPEAAAAVISASRPAMAATLGYLDDRYGGIERYVTGPGGMHLDAVDALRVQLVESLRS